jgi:hypothetical protein
MSEVTRCFYCRAFVQKDDRFCWSCGRDLAPPEETKAAPELPLDENLSREDWRYLRRAYLAHSRGDSEEAERLVRVVLHGNPEHVPSLTLLAEIRRSRGDLVEAVAAAQDATDAARETGVAPPGAVKRAREERAEIEENVIRDVIGYDQSAAVNPIGAFRAQGRVWYRSGGCYFVLAGLGVAALFLALMLALRGYAYGYLYVGVSLLAAGWTYHDAESSRRIGLLWGPLVLFLGPFGLAIYLLSRY